MRAIAWTALMAIAALGTGCNREAVYTPGELHIESRFKSVRVGTTEGELRSRLGDPICVIRAVEGGQDRLEARCPEESPPQSLKPGDRSTYPDQLPALPTERPTVKLLVYADATVWAYYFIDERGRVSLVEVRIS